MEQATLEAGCFWSMKSFLPKQPGVLDEVSGDAGGRTQNPTCKEVCNNRTGHTEIMQVTFDPAKVCYDGLPNAFFRDPDPTQSNRQRADFGIQYRSTIVFHSPEQEYATGAKKALADRINKLLATTIKPTSAFWRAKEFRQRHFEKNRVATCHLCRAKGS